MDQEIVYKTCKICAESKEINKYIPRSLVCKKCVNKKDAGNRLLRNRKYYYNNKDIVCDRNLLSYYQNKFDNKNLTMHEVNLLKISV